MESARLPRAMWHHWNEKGWKDKEFTSYDKAIIDSKATFHIPGIRMPIKFHQYCLVVWQLRRQPETDGRMVGDTMGAGKVCLSARRRTWVITWPNPYRRIQPW